MRNLVILLSNTSSGALQFLWHPVSYKESNSIEFSFRTTGWRKDKSYFVFATTPRPQNRKQVEVGILAITRINYECFRRCQPYRTPLFWELSLNQVWIKWKSLVKIVKMLATTHRETTRFEGYPLNPRQWSFYTNMAGSDRFKFG
jgi:hypothetical protein